MNFDVFTIFPDMLPGSLAMSIAGKALEKKLWSYNIINIRDYATDKHKSVDDSPFGGGTGMVMRADVISSALASNVKKGTRIIYPSPRGKLFKQSDAVALAKEENIAIICGRFEGIDQRVIDFHNIEEYSIGDYILSGGELAALVMMDSCIRLIPGVISKEDAVIEESFGLNSDYAGLLEYPLYTRPQLWEDIDVPEVLLSGNHKEISSWRLQKAKEITKSRRPDLWLQYVKEKKDEQSS